MLEDFLKGEPIPPHVAAEGFAEMKKTAGPKELHPMDAALGALIGGGYGVHQARTRHKKLPSGESSFSKKLRKDLEYHLEMRQETGAGKKPSFGDRVKEKMIRTQLRYANIAQNNPHAAMALEGVAGAGAGALVGATVGDAIRNDLLKRGAAVVGISEQVLEKKAEYLGVPTEKALTFELHAYQLTKEADLSSGDQRYLKMMQDVQAAVTGEPPAPLKRAQLSKSAAVALHKTASMGELLISKEMAKEVQKEEPPFEAVEQAAAELEPDDHRAPVRAERRKELLGIFGGSTPKTASLKEALGPAFQKAMKRRSR